MPIHFLGKLLAIGSSPRGEEARLTAVSSQEREAFERLVSDLKNRAPVDLHETFQDAIQAFAERPATGPELLDAMYRMHMGLGVAIGRGGTGEDQRYRQLGQVVSWLYEELGRPQNTQYAAIMRGATGLKASE